MNFWNKIEKYFIGPGDGVTRRYKSILELM
jgi:hypothetical protein